MFVTIVTDSTCDLNKYLITQKGIRVVPLRIQVGPKSYIDGVNLSTADLYDILLDKNNRDFPTTSQPSVQDFIDTYSSIKGEIISIHIASTLSGTVNVATKAKELMGADGNRIHIYDSESLTLAMGLQVLFAQEEAEKGKSAEDIIESLKKLNEQIKLYFSLSDLTYVYRGGRISKATMAIGNLLKIKPIITFKNKELKQIDKAFGNAQIINKLVDIVKKDHLIRPIKRIFVAHGGCQEYLPQLEEKINQNIQGDYELYRGEIGATIAVHAGPGALGVMYY